MAKEITVLSKTTTTVSRNGVDRSKLEFELLFVYDLGAGIVNGRGTVVVLTPAADLPERVLTLGWLEAPALAGLNNGTRAFEQKHFRFGPGTTIQQMLDVARSLYRQTKTAFIERHTDELEMAGDQANVA